MASYQVLSSNLTVAEKGETVTDEQLAHCNIPALIQGGHLARVSKPKAEAEKTGDVNKEQK